VPATSPPTSRHWLLVSEAEPGFAWGGVAAPASSAVVKSVAQVLPGRICVGASPRCCTTAGLRLVISTWVRLVGICRGGATFRLSAVRAFAFFSLCVRLLVLIHRSIVAICAVVALPRMLGRCQAGQRVVGAVEVAVISPDTLVCPGPPPLAYN